MPTFNPRIQRASEHNKKQADKVLQKYSEFLPAHYTELVQEDLCNRNLKGKYTNQQIHSFIHRRNYHAEICQSVENVGKQYYVTTAEAEKPQYPLQP